MARSTRAAWNAPPTDEGGTVTGARTALPSSDQAGDDQAYRRMAIAVNRRAIAHRPSEAKTARTRKGRCRTPALIVTTWFPSLGRASGWASQRFCDADYCKGSVASKSSLTWQTSHTVTFPDGRPNSPPICSHQRHKFRGVLAMVPGWIYQGRRSRWQKLWHTLRQGKRFLPRRFSGGRPVKTTGSSAGR
jgi:hypothetical protein